MIWLLRLLDAVRPAKSIIVSDVVCDYANPFEILSLEGSSSFFASNAGIGGYARSASLGVQWAKHRQHRHLSHIRRIGAALAARALDRRALRSARQVRHSQQSGTSNFSMHLVPMLNNPHRVLLDSPPIDMRDLARSMKVPAYSVDTIAALETSLQKMFETRPLRPRRPHRRQLRLAS